VFDVGVSPVQRRHVIYVSGYDPRGAQGYFDLFRRTCQRFERLWPVSARLKPIEIASEDFAHWGVALYGPNWRTVTHCDFLRLETCIRSDMEKPTGWQVLRGLGWIGADLLSGAMFRIFAASWRFALHLLYFQSLLLTWVAARLARSQTGRNWIAVRDMEIAATVMGVPVARTKLYAFAISSFYCGIAGALWAFCYLGTVEPAGFDLAHSFEVLFIIILGGLGSIRGAFFGAALMVVFPLLLSRFANSVLTTALDPGQQENIQKIVFGSLIIVFLIVEPRGLASLCKSFERRLRQWPFRG